jgi:acetyl esterase/lipase
MFSIDSDRVFLTGHSSGATAAYDIGLSHPEHWAGIIGIGGQLEKYTYSYSDNRHVDLPVYSVVGQKDGAARNNKKAWNQWLHSDRYLDCVLVEYKGRLNEPFHEEMPSIFDWTAAHQRILPDKSGFELDFKTLRPWDNYFWFWELHGFPESSVQRPEHWSSKLPKNPVRMTVKLAANQPNVFIGVGPKKTGTHGTIWLSPDLVDFNKKIIIQGRGRGFRNFVKPSSKVLLDDVRRRADRKHPYWARIDCNEGVWKVPASANDGS